LSTIEETYKILKFIHYENKKNEILKQSVGRVCEEKKHLEHQLSKLTKEIRLLEKKQKKLERCKERFQFELEKKQFELDKQRYHESFEESTFCKKD